ncbi:hypothetical protein EVAR_23487_1 [Eumeta japonica]|uniref:Uncharacterized protein n=1 Tax=Eumeta variegata TaxID=151549 RepID=A0A4C1UJW3_EUMVA|nr:hypothetical protein EVAR_23487_1 [Eumeta japonica]
MWDLRSHLSGVSPRRWIFRGVPTSRSSRSPDANMKTNLFPLLISNRGAYILIPTRWPSEGRGPPPTFVVDTDDDVRAPARHVLFEAHNVWYNLT